MEISVKKIVKLTKNFKLRLLEKTFISGYGGFIFLKLGKYRKSHEQQFQHNFF